MAKVLVIIRIFAISLFLLFYCMVRKAVFVFSIFLSVAFFVAPVFAYSSPGDRDGLVNDFANMLAADTEKILVDQLKQAQEASMGEVVVVTIPTLGGDTIENYAGKLFSEWSLERSFYTKGVLLLVARDERQVRILAGSGLTDVLSDEKSDEIIQQVIIPAFQTDNFNDGVVKGAQAIVAAVQNPASDETKSGKGSPWGILYFVVGVVVIVILGKVLSKKNGGSGKSGGGSSSAGSSSPKTSSMTGGAGASGKW